MCDVYRETRFIQKNDYKWAKLFKDGQNSNQDVYKQGRLTMMILLEMVDSVNAFILADKSVTMEDISEQLRIFVGTSVMYVMEATVQHTKLCMMTLPFLKSVVIGLPKCWCQSTKPHTATRTAETISCQTFL